MARKVFEPQNVTTTSLHKDGYCLVEGDPKLGVYGALPDEELVVMPFTRKQRKYFARPTELLSSSPDRVEPPCSVADLCGGCSLQHMNSAAQVAFKQSKVASEFGDTQPTEWYAPILGDVLHYRAKARLGVKYVDKKDRVLVGFREKLKPYIVETQTCQVLKSSASALPSLLSQLVSTLSIPREIPQIEVASGDEKTALVIRHLAAFNEDDLDKLSEFGATQDLDIYLQPGNAESVTKLFPDDDKFFLEYRLPEFDLNYEFAPLDFTQVNSSINKQMVARAIELLQLEKDDVVFDGFCGIGNFSLPIAQQVERVIGVEGMELSVQRARHNADLNGINNCLFIAQDLFSETLEIKGFQEVNKVLIDPPRSGAEALCKRLASRKVERVVYVSCNPVTLARDTKILVSNGYRFDGAGVIDMFPHTTHVESIASFSIL